MSRDEALRVLSTYLAPTLAAQAAANKVPDIVDWAEREFYIADTGMPIELQQHQKTFLRWAANCGMANILYSTVKKSGKTAISGLFSRYRAEFSGNNAEVYMLANDRDQAKDRAYIAALQSIERTPGYQHGRRLLPGLWRIIERQAMHVPTSSFMRAIAGDYEGAAGSNPTLTSWTELWGMTSERMKRLWDEMTPVPTRERSERFVETYAGFTDESILLYELYKGAVRQAHRLTRDELTKYAGSDVDPWPFADEPRFFLNEATRTFAYWDDGPHAQTRMPWQTSERGRSYYYEHAQTDRPEAYQRLHLNYWVSSAQSFIEPAWWTACKKPLAVELPKDWPIVLGVDGSVNSDCTAAVGVAREPVLVNGKIVASDTEVRVVFAKVWVPPRGGVIDLEDVEAYLRAICGQASTIEDLERKEAYATHRIYNVVQIAYDAYQLALMMQRLGNSFVAWCRPFSQAGDREIADKALYDSILNRTIHHNDEFSAEYMENAAAYVGSATSKIADRLRIVKKSPDAKVDPVVTLSMAAYECRRLLLS